jgi:uncharacterized protein (DUF433 family)
MPFPHIVRNPNILGGKPIIGGTRISVDFLLEMMAAGRTIPDILDGYPFLSEELIREALAFAATELRQEDVDLMVVHQ